MADDEPRRVDRSHVSETAELPDPHARSFADERGRLLPLPDPLPETARVEPVQIDRQAFVRVDTNRYSVPSDHAEKVRTLDDLESYDE